jgi:Zn finger protein HypA/HybF involved in hydrogenase expression
MGHWYGFTQQSTKTCQHSNLVARITRMQDGAWMSCEKSPTGCHCRHHHQTTKETDMFVWTISDMLGLVAVTITFIIWTALLLCKKIRESRCKHNRAVSETQACDAICQDCGKNLGFIGTWREQQRRMK